MKLDSMKPKSDINKCPKTSGMYWLYRKNDFGWCVVYVGISNNLYRRLQTHLLNKDFDTFFYEEYDYQSVKRREKQLLRSYKNNSGILPPLNKKIG